MEENLDFEQSRFVEDHDSDIDDAIQSMKNLIVFLKNLKNNINGNAPKLSEFQIDDVQKGIINMRRMIMLLHDKFDFNVGVARQKIAQSRNSSAQGVSEVASTSSLEMVQADQNSTSQSESEVRENMKQAQGLTSQFSMDTRRNNSPDLIILETQSPPTKASLLPPKLVLPRLKSDASSDFPTNITESTGIISSENRRNRNPTLRKLLLSPPGQQPGISKFEADARPNIFANAAKTFGIGSNLDPEIGRIWIPSPRELLRFQSHRKPEVSHETGLPKNTAGSIGIGNNSILNIERFSPPQRQLWVPPPGPKPEISQVETDTRTDLSPSASESIGIRNNPYLETEEVPVLRKLLLSPPGQKPVMSKFETDVRTDFFVNTAEPVEIRNNSDSELKRIWSPSPRKLFPESHQKPGMSYLEIDDETGLPVSNAESTGIGINSILNFKRFCSPPQIQLWFSPPCPKPEMSQVEIDTRPSLSSSASKSVDTRNSPDLEIEEVYCPILRKCLLSPPDQKFEVDPLGTSTLVNSSTSQENKQQWELETDEIQDLSARELEISSTYSQSLVPRHGDGTSIFVNTSESFENKKEPELKISRTCGPAAEESLLLWHPESVRSQLGTDSGTDDFASTSKSLGNRHVSELQDLDISSTCPRGEHFRLGNGTVTGISTSSFKLVKSELEITSSKSYLLLSSSRPETKPSQLGIDSSTDSFVNAPALFNNMSNAKFQEDIGIVNVKAPAPEEKESKKRKFLSMLMENPVPSNSFSINGVLSRQASSAEMTMNQSPRPKSEISRRNEVNSFPIQPNHRKRCRMKKN